MKHQKKLLSALCAGAVLVAAQGTAFAEESLQDQLSAMKQQVQLLEQKIEAGDTGGSAWYKNVTVSGVIEVEASYAKADGSSSESDLNLATAELGFEAAINDAVSANIVLLAEEDGNGIGSVEIDQAVVTLSPESTGDFTFTLGRTYVPFGAFETNLVSDPLTLEIGETSETVAMANYAANGFVGNAYIFNGDQDEDGGNNSIISNFGLNAGYAWEDGEQSASASIGYISNLGDSDGLEGSYSTYSSDIPGVAVSAMYTIGDFNLIGEYVGATEDDDAGNRPDAWLLEAGYSFGETTVAINYQETSEAANLDLPESRIALGVSFPLMEDVSLGLEWAHDTDYDDADSDSVTALLTVEF